MVLGVDMGLQLVQGVGVEVAGVAPDLGGVGAGQHPQLPLVAGSALPDVVEERQPGQVLVCLAVELEVGLQIGFVRAEFADVGVPQEHGHLPLPLHRPVHGDVRGERVHDVRVEFPADDAVEQLGGVGVGHVPGLLLPRLAPGHNELLQGGASLPGGQHLEEEGLVVVRQVHHHHHLPAWPRLQRRHGRHVAALLSVGQRLQELQPLQLLHVLLDGRDVLDVLLAGHVDPQIPRLVRLKVADVTPPEVLLLDRLCGIQSL